ncbi:MAG: NAD(P)H-hydrate epimerase [Candidatus Omnitrophota bacterium]
MLKLSSQKIREIDQRAQKEFSIPGLILMENAGLRASDIILGLLNRRKKKSVFIFCGPGNNGGDGFVVARHLINQGIKVRVFLLAESRKLKGDARKNFQILKAMQAQIIEFSRIPYLKNPVKALQRAGLIIDAVFGIGLNKNVNDFFEEVINLINATRVPVISLDTPSGLCPNTGEIFNTAIKAHTTITFAAAKQGFFIKQGPSHIGKLIIADISIPRGLLHTDKT